MVRVRTSDKICCDLNLSENSTIKITSLDITKALEKGELPIVVVNQHNNDENAHSQIITGLNNQILQKANISDVPTKISDLTDDTSTNPINKAETLTGLTATISELNYCDGVTSNIQTQINNKYDASNPNGFITSSGSITGNAETATKASQDGNGNNIVATYQPKIFNKDKFVIVGNPTITDDGVASGFSASDYITATTTDISSSNFSIKISFTLNSIKLQKVLEYGGLIVRTEGTAMFVSLTNGSDNIFSYWNSILEPVPTNTQYSIKVEKNGTNYSISLKIGSNDWVVKSTTTSAINPSSMTNVTFGNGSSNLWLDGSIDLKQFSISVDGVEVFNGLYNNTSEIKHIIETYNNGVSWYRVYSDGWCEQGGGFGSAWSGAQDKTITFLKPFSNTNYQVNGLNSATTNQAFYINGNSGSKTTTQITFSGVVNDNGWASWEAKGYIN